VPRFLGPLRFDGASERRIRTPPSGRCRSGALADQVKAGAEVREHVAGAFLLRDLVQQRTPAARGARIGAQLRSIRHQRQLSFDLQRFWSQSPRTGASLAADTPRDDPPAGTAEVRSRHALLP
jgi:hypothetical protein